MATLNHYTEIAKLDQIIARDLASLESLAHSEIDGSQIQMEMNRLNDSLNENLERQRILIWGLSSPRTNQ